MFARAPPATALPGGPWAPSGERWGGKGMRQGAWNRRFTAPLAVLAVLLIAPAADAVSLARQCRQACGDEIASCVAGGGRRLACKRQMLRRCRTEGLGVCHSPEAPAILAGSCTSPTVSSAQGGTFTGTTSGTSLLAGRCGNSGGAPGQVFQWAPTVSGTATIQAGGAGTNFDTVLYMRSGVCSGGPEVVSGCNDDTCPNSSGLFRASRIMPTVAAGQTYFIVVDGYGGAQGTFSLTVTAPGASATTTLTAATSTTTTTLPGACSSPTVISAAGGTFSGTTSGTTSQAGSCGSSGTSPERVFQWTPTVSGTATIQTCGGSTSYDTVLYVRSGACGTGSEIALGCNDDACADATGANRASRITPTVTAGQTYYIFVDGFGGAQGNFTLTVLPPVPTTTTTLPPTTTTTTTTTLPPTTTSTTSTTTTTRPPTTTTTTPPPTTTTTTSTTTSTTATTTTT